MRIRLFASGAVAVVALFGSSCSGIKSLLAPNSTVKRATLAPEEGSTQMVASLNHKAPLAMRSSQRPTSSSPELASTPQVKTADSTRKITVAQTLPKPAADTRPKPQVSKPVTPAPLVKKQPQPILIAESKPTPTPKPNPTPTRTSSAPSQVVRTTAYTHLEADSLPYGKKNAAGGTLKYGRVRSAAADWSVYPVGTLFKMEGDPNVYEIDDYGSALVGSKTIDIYKPSMASMNDWGVRHVPIKVLRWGCFEKSLEILEPREYKASHVRKMADSIRAKGL